VVLTQSLVVAEAAAVDLILGSASPRRADLLAHAGYSFRVETVDIDEVAARTHVDDGDIVAATTAIARAKFEALGQQGCLSPRVPLLTADTLVACEGKTMGKPESDGEVATMLATMSGQQLEITTAVCVGRAGEHPRELCVTTLVRLTELSPAQIDRYVETGVGLDKAAGLALQSEAGGFIASLDQCWSNVLGLPLCAVHAALREDYSAASDPYCAPTRCGQL
jgi:septum formation protein